MTQAHLQITEGKDEPNINKSRKNPSSPKTTWSQT